MITRQEELDGAGLCKNLFQRPIIEVLRTLRHAALARRLQQRLAIVDAVTVNHDVFGLFIRVKEDQHGATGPQHTQQMIDRLIEQGLRKELQSIPH